MCKPATCDTCGISTPTSATLELILTHHHREEVLVGLRPGKFLEFFEKHLPKHIKPSNRQTVKPRKNIEICDQEIFVHKI
jgi:hypothetical protein